MSTFSKTRAQSQETDRLACKPSITASDGDEHLLSRKGEWRLNGWRRGGVNPCNTRWPAPPHWESVCINSTDILLISLCKQRQYYWYFLLSKMPFLFYRLWCPQGLTMLHTLELFFSILSFLLLKTVVKCKHFRKLMKIIIEKTHVARRSLQHYLQELKHGSNLNVHRQMNS